MIDGNLTHLISIFEQSENKSLIPAGRSRAWASYTCGAAGVSNGTSLPGRREANAMVR